MPAFAGIVSVTRPSEVVVAMVAMQRRTLPESGFYSLDSVFCGVGKLAVVKSDHIE